MPTLIGDTEDLDFEVWCSKCGAGLCGNATVKPHQGYGGSQRVYIDPCEKCLDVAASDGYDEGYEEGQTEGHEAGFREGEEAGWNRGVDHGRHEGRREGEDRGRQAGYDEGYRAGHREGESMARRNYGRY